MSYFPDDDDRIQELGACLEGLNWVGLLIAAAAALVLIIYF
ncbi:MAG: hypothetical protein WC736_15705 [Gallionella sp.]|jgi:hypothetical protein